MSEQYSQELLKLIREKMATGCYASEEALLVEALESLDSSDEDVRAVEAGLESVRRGEPGVSVEEAFRRVRDRHQIRE
jgi:hypothetical protein